MTSCPDVAKTCGMRIAQRLPMNAGIARGLAVRKTTPLAVRTRLRRVVFAPWIRVAAWTHGMRCARLWPAAVFVRHAAEMVCVDSTKTAVRVQVIAASAAAMGFATSLSIAVRARLIVVNARVRVVWPMLLQGVSIPR